MSAFIVTSDTIDVIVAAGIKYNVITAHAADVVGQSILAQNIRAVATAYPDTLANGGMPGAMPVEYVPHVLTPAAYSFTPFERKLRRKAVEGAISIWAYQCAEFEDSGHTAISQLVAMIQERNMNRILIADPDYVRSDEFGDVTDRDAVMLNVRQPLVAVVPAAPVEGDEDDDIDVDWTGAEDDWEADDDDVAAVTTITAAVEADAEAEADESDGV